MYDLSSVIAGFLQQQKASGNLSNVKEKLPVTEQGVDFKEGNPSNLGNIKLFDKQTIIQMLTEAAQASGLTGQQIWRFLDDSDIEDLRQGLIDQITLNTYAKSWARYPEYIPEGNTQPFPRLEYEVVQCKQCHYFIADKVGDGSGIGTCSINAPASKKGLMWLNSERFCDLYQ